MENIVVTPEQIAAFEKDTRCSIHINDPAYGENKLHICYITDTGWGVSMKTWALPKRKPVDLKYIADKFQTMKDYHSTYKNLTPIFENLILEGDIYYTSFGFSYNNLFKNEKRFKLDTDRLSDKLKELGIKFSTEFSDACWVFRFRISQSKENINRIKNLSSK